MSDQDRIRLTFSDAEGRTAANLIYVSPGTSDENVELSNDAIDALTVSHIVQLRRDTALIGPTGGAGGAGAYNTHRDMVTFQFNTSEAGKWPITVPAPNATIFNVDNETVDALDAAVAVFIEWALEFATTNDGVALIGFDRGWRWFLNE